MKGRCGEGGCGKGRCVRGRCGKGGRYGYVQKGRRQAMDTCKRELALQCAECYTTSMNVGYSAIPPGM